jgi:DNA-binding MarR family transcriptional regulator
MPAARPLPTVIGPTENALRALLSKILSTTRIKPYPAWVILNALSNADAASSGHWQLAIADALKVELGEVDDVLAQLHAAGLVSNHGSLTALGSSELATGRSAVSAATSRLVDGIGEEEQTTARLVLDHVLRKAEELLRL